MRSDSKILLFGASQQCRSAIDIIEQVGQYEIAGILDDSLPAGTMYGGYPIFGKIDELAEIIASTGIQKGLIAIGDHGSRMRIAQKIQQLAPGFTFVSGIHPSVIIGKNSSIGAGSLAMAGVIINNDSRIGMHCYLGNKTSIDHDCEVGDFVNISPGVTTGGCVKIGNCTAIGLGANIIHGMKIGDHTVVGAGSLVVKEIPDHVVAYGNPAKVIRGRQEGERYL